MDKKRNHEDSLPQDEFPNKILRLNISGKRDRCRTCLSDETNSKSLTDKIELNSAEISLTDLIFISISVKISLDSLPQNICIKCIEDARTCYQFKSKCERSQKLLLQETLKVENEANINDLDRSNDNDDILSDTSDSIFQKIHSDSIQGNLNVKLEQEGKSHSTNQNCSACDQSFQKYDDLVDHVRKFHTKLSELKEQPSTDDLNNTNTRKYKCCQCNEKFTKSELAKHRKTHQYFICNICQAEFSVFTSYKSHLRQKHSRATPTKPEEVLIKLETIKYRGKPEKVKRFFCETCGFASKTKHAYDTHAKKHVKKKHECIECDKKFPSALALKKHYNEHNGTFHCKHCTSTFSSIAVLRKHIKKVCNNSKNDQEQSTTRKNQQQMVTCQFCGLKIGRNFRNDHFKQVHSGPMECLQCNDIYEGWQKLEHHQLSHTEYRCHQCDFDAEDLNDLRIHRDEYHDFDEIHPEGLKTCIECNQLFATIELLRTHYKSHTSYKCKECDGEYDGVLSLIRHSSLYETDASASTQDRTCTVCERGFLVTMNMWKHRAAQHSGTNNGIRYCPYCTYCSGSTNILGKHMETEHESYKTIFCEVCNKAFFSRKRLSVHMLTHSGEKRHVCDVCGHRFALSGNLRTHMHIHNKARPYKCDHCDRGFAQISALKSHAARHRPHDKNYVCSECGMCFTRLSGLRQHKERHATTRVFACEVCGKTFVTKRYLKIHAQIHTGVKGFVCGVCGKAFSRSSALTVHGRIHTGEKPHGCTICEKRFIQAHVLRGHMKTHGLDLGEKS